MDEFEFVKLVERAAECAPGSVGFDSVLEHIAWDSLAVISLISELDKFGGYSVSAESIVPARTVRDLYAAVFG